LLHEQLTQLGRLPHASKPSDLAGALHTFASSLRTRYEPRGAYHGPTLLISASDPWPRESLAVRNERDVYDGWKIWAPNLSHSEAEGNHMTVLSLPHARVLASLVGDYIGHNSPPC
jgi:hypothetical protein